MKRPHFKEKDSEGAEFRVLLVRSMLLIEGADLMFEIQTRFIRRYYGYPGERLRWLEEIGCQAFYPSDTHHLIQLSPWHRPLPGQNSKLIHRDHHDR